MTARAERPAAPGGAGRDRTKLVAVLQGIRPYDRSLLSRDVVAGITLAVLAIPEVMGYTKIVGTPVVSGLYTILLPAVAFALLGSSRHLVVGGDSATAAILYAGIAGLGVAGLQPGTDRWLAYASVAALMTGGLLLVARVASLGFLADFISRTVLVGFLTGVGIQVALDQVGAMLGIPPPDVGPSRTSGTLITFWKTLQDVSDTSLTTLGVALAVVATLVVFQRWINAIPGGLVAVVGAIAVSWAFDLQAHGVSVLGPVPSGLPPLGLPSGVGWNEAMALLPTVASMFLVIVAQSAATSRAYAVKYRERFVEDNDLVGLTAANVVAGLSATFVVNGSPTKTAMADEAKARTQVAMIATAVTVAVVLLWLTRPLQYMPNVMLAAVVFVIGIKLIDLRHLREIQRLRPGEFAIAVATAATVVVVGVEQGIVVAIVLSLVSHVRRHYAPHNAVISRNQAGDIVTVAPAPGVDTEPGLIVYRFAVGLFYANAPRFATEALALVDVPDPPRWFVLLADAIDDIDFTGGKTLLEVVDQMSRRNIVVAIADPQGAVLAELDRFGITAAVGAGRIYASLEEAVAAYHAT